MYKYSCRAGCCVFVDPLFLFVGSPWLVTRLRQEAQAGLQERGVGRRC
jgi:hypothetical protein